MKFQAGDYEASHLSPVWRDRADFVFAAHIGAKDGRNEWEQLWGQKIGAQRLTLCCIPFFVYDVALGDEVEINSDFVLQRVLRESGQVTFRVWFGGRDSTTRQDLVRDIETFTSLMEWSSENLLAISVPKSEAPPLADYLQLRENDGLLQYEIGCS